MASTLNLHRQAAVGFLEWLGLARYIVLHESPVIRNTLHSAVSVVLTASARVCLTPDARRSEAERAPDGGFEWINRLMTTGLA